MKLSTAVRYAALFAFGTSLASVHAGQPAPPWVPGLYEVLICTGPCTVGSYENVALHGQVALLPQAMSNAAAQRFGMGYYPTYQGEVPNACFMLDKLANHDYVGLAGMDRFGISGWRAEGETVRFALAHSPDAGYEAVVRPSASGFEGQGTSWGGAVGPKSGPPIRPDRIIGRRIGSADSDTCVRLHQMAATTNSRSH